METKIKLLQKKLSDERSKKVIFLSHCLLNENTRYLGGATRKGGVDELIDELQNKGIGIIQMRCPEQKAWGGVLKKEMLKIYGTKDIPKLLKRLYLNKFIQKTKKIYKELAEEISEEIKDYKDSGFTVIGIVCVKGSPSCGLSASLDLVKSAEFLASIDLDSLNKDCLNCNLYKNCLSSEQGLFVVELKKSLKNKELEVVFFEHNLLSELKGDKLLTFEI